MPGLQWCQRCERIWLDPPKAAVARAEQCSDLADIAERDRMSALPTGHPDQVNDYAKREYLKLKAFQQTLIGAQGLTKAARER
jgi:hypothetical protein